MAVLDRIKAPFLKLGRFLREVVFELKRVVWPTKDEAYSFTAVVLIAIGVVAVWVGSLDWLCTFIVSSLRLYSK